LTWQIIDPVTGAITPLSDLLGAEISIWDSFSLSPDEKHVVLNVTEQAGRAVLRDIGTGTEITLTIAPGVGGYATWSPDSSRFILEAEESLTIVSSEGTPLDTIPLPIVKGSGFYAVSPRWSPDGGSLIFSVAEAHGVGVCD
jgi:Tol biopolymer transport system component